ncbi:MAG: hypothetical protein ACLRL0_00090 [Christensenellaceae bacterium]
MLENTESQEMYLTTIYALQKKNGMVRSVLLMSQMNVDIVK